ncbi:MAG: hypothetical protein DCF27_13815 [Lysobacteraceae bacterium]|nr:MAG: hypothetical protein DCF27_13815 [Xanthomonadaceae bacterium]
MTAPSSLFRPLLIGAVAIAMLSQSGCAWTRSKLGMDANYQDSVQNQPLEVPPGLDAPLTLGAVTVPDLGPNAGSASIATGVPGTSAVASFTLDDSLESAWRRIGIALGKIDGVSNVEPAQALSSYEVTFQGATMLVRAQTSNGQTSVVALGPDGQPLGTGPAAQLLGLLKARLG